MTGTSMDGLDACLIRVTSDRPQLLAFESAPMPADLRARLQALQAGRLPGQFDALDEAAACANELALAMAPLVSRLQSQSDLGIRAIGIHGQTLRHRPEAGYSIQIAAPALLAEVSGLDVIYDFRSRDLAAGGQGAPLVPVFHQEMLGARRTELGPEDWLGLLNLGGIANLTLFSGPGEVLGFDTGPGNVLLDAWAARQLGEPFDRDGQLASSGQVIQPLLDRLQAHPYFSLQGPKSTGRDVFHEDWLLTELAEFNATDSGRATALDPADVAASLVALTAETVARATKGVTANRLKGLFVCGGGSRNPALMAALSERLALPIETTDRLGWPSQTVEASAFAWLAHLFLEGRPGNLPAVTGARGPRVLGSLHPALIVPRP